METTRSARLLRIAREALAKRAEAAEQEGAEAGFTLIELMVVLLIMAILLAIAIPTFLGVKGGAQDRASQSNLSNALISAKSTYATNGNYCAASACGATIALNTTALLGVLSTQEPELAFTSGQVSTANNSMSVEVSVSGQQIVLVDQSASKTCWAISDNNGDAAAGSLGKAGSGTLYTEWTVASGTCVASLTAGGALTSTTGWLTQFPSSAPTAGP